MISVSERLRTSELRYRRLFESAKDGILILDATSGRIEDVNPFLIDLLGLSHEQFIGKEVWELGLFKHIVANKNKFLELQQHKYVRYDDLPLETLDGRQIAVEFVSNVYLENENKVIQCNIRDISERKQREEVLHQSEIRYHALFSNMMEGFCYCRMLFEAGVPKDFVYLDVNQAFMSLTGLENVIGRKVSEVIPGILESDPDMFARYGRVAHTGRPEQFEIYVKAVGMWFSMTLYCPEKDHFVSMFNIITERKKAETRMQLQSSALEAAANAIVITDSQGVMEWVNTAFTSFTGYSFAEAVEKNTNLLKSGKQDEKFYQTLWATISAGRVWTGELVNRRKDGSLYTEELVITPLKLTGLEITHYIAVAQDITERKKLESQFLRVQRMESLGTLAGGIAHDLNNVLTPILMAVGMLEDKATDQEDKELLASLAASANHGAELVRQVLGFARGIEGKRIPVNLTHTMQDIQKIIRDTFPKNIQFQCAPGLDVRTVTGDPTQLQQVFTNLCVNSRDAMPEGGSLSVTLENTDLDDVYAGLYPGSKPGSYVLVMLTDSGVGMPPGILERIFEPFFTTKDPGKGTGMGLSTSMAIVKSHGGFINVYSEKGKGSTFKVYLPAEATTESGGTPPLQKDPLPLGRGECVLFVDDDENVRIIAQKTLEFSGYRVLLAVNGAEAIALYAQHREEIDLVFTDMSMPVMDGAVTLAALKVMNPLVKTIASSGLTVNGKNPQATAAGFKHFLPKPYTAEAMLTLLATALREQP